MICGLSKEFSRKTKEERENIFNKLLNSPVMHTDFTFGRVGGKQATVILCSDGNLVLCQGRDKKGYEGVEGSLVTIFHGIIVSDHKKTFFKFGTKHQECLVHVKRYLQSSDENEPELKWSKKMIEWIEKAIHCRNEAVRNNTQMEKTDKKFYI